MSHHKRKNRKIVLKQHHKHKIIGGLCGIAICLIGSAIATWHQDLLPVFIVDGIAYFIHGLGCIPIIKCIEPVLALIFHFE